MLRLVLGLGVRDGVLGESVMVGTDRHAFVCGDGDGDDWFFGVLLRGWMRWR